jgi:hypothetical protein
MHMQLRLWAGEEAAEQPFDDERGVLTELWVECGQCGLRVNVVETVLDCGCGPTSWRVVPERTKRAALSPSGLGRSRYVKTE